MLDIGKRRDQSLIDRIRHNDRTVLGELYITYERLVFHQIRKMGGNTSQAEDILQESVITLWQKVSSGDFNLTSRLGTFMVAVARNKYLSEHRRIQHTATQEPDENEADDNPDALEVIIRAEEAEMVKRALEKLHSICRQILMLFYFERRSLSDIAQLMHFADEQVAKSKKYQCKKALQEIIKKEMSLAEGKS